MQYFYDTEFIEDGRSIDLISIGIVAEDGRRYYAVSSEFDESKASDWVKENVICHLPPSKERLPKHLIAQQVRDFITEDDRNNVHLWADYSAYDHVALCQLFGTMMDLPPNIPMYTNDFQQLLRTVAIKPGRSIQLENSGNDHHALEDALFLKKQWESVRG